MKIIAVQGDDYAAVVFEEQFDVKEKGMTLVKEAIESGYLDQWFTEESDNSGGLSYDIMEFGPVDPKFIAWIKDRQDHDDSKTENFYILEGDDAK